MDPNHILHAVVLGLAFVVLGAVLSWMIKRMTRRALHRGGSRKHDAIAFSFVSQFAVLLLWVLLATFYAHLVPALNRIGTALLAGVSVMSIVIGFAAQTTLGNLIAGLSLVLYKQFEEGDRIQVPAPTAQEFEVGVVTGISLGYTTILTDDGREVVVANGSMAQQTVIKLLPNDRAPVASGQDKAKE